MLAANKNEFESKARGAGQPGNANIAARWLGTSPGSEMEFQHDIRRIEN
jgi:hypothetical protein